MVAGGERASQGLARRARRRGVRAGRLLPGPAGRAWRRSAPAAQPSAGAQLPTAVRRAQTVAMLGQQVQVAGDPPERLVVEPVEPSLDLRAHHQRPSHTVHGISQTWYVKDVPMSDALPDKRPAGDPAPPARPSTQPGCQDLFDIVKGPANDPKLLRRLPRLTGEALALVWASGPRELLVSVGLKVTGGLGLAVVLLLGRGVLAGVLDADQTGTS